MARSSFFKEDRLSNLPEPILDQIISLLSMKEAIATSILSKHWRFLWTSVTNLDISDAGSQLTNSDFGNFVNRIFLLIHQPAIHRFALKLTKFPDRFCMSKWICDAVDRKVREFEVELQVFTFEDPVHLPTSLCYLETLEVLRLSTGVSLTIPKSSFISFPSLKFLSIDDVHSFDIPAEGSDTFPVLKTLRLVSLPEEDEKVNNIIRNCPTLEHMFITRNDYSESLVINSSTLTSLELYDSMEELYSKVEIYAPNLRYFTVSEWCINQAVLVKEPNSIIEARLNGLVYVDCLEVLDDLMKVVENVQSLILTGSSLDDMEVLIPIMPFFRNLTRLEVDLSCCGLNALQCFLEKSMNLQQMVIKMVASSHNHNTESCTFEQKSCSQQAIVPKFLTSGLKNVKIHCEIDCNILELVLIENILKNATKLEKMEIVISSIESHKRNQVIQNISSVPRASVASEVLFS